MVGDVEAVTLDVFLLFGVIDYFFDVYEARQTRPKLPEWTFEGIIDATRPVAVPAVSFLLPLGDVKRLILGYRGHYLCFKFLLVAFYLSDIVVT